MPFYFHKGGPLDGLDLYWSAATERAMGDVYLQMGIGYSGGWRGGVE